jgi:outer membrane protein TolC
VYRDQSDKLKALINDPDLDINSNILINPTDQPISDPVAYETLDCIETALRQRPELQQARLQLERADIVIRVARNALLPQVDLTLALQANGLDHGFDQSYVRTVDPMNHLDATVGIKFEIPIGNRDAEYKLKQHEAERNQAITNLVQGAQQVVQDVKAQLREVYSSYEEIAYRDRVRVAAANEFQGIIDLENIRPRTPEFLQLKLDSQARLAQAEQQLIQSIVNYNLAIMRLEQAKGTLLEFDRISLDKAPKQPENTLLNALRFDGTTFITK